MYFGGLSKIQGLYWSYLSNWRIILFGLPSNPLLFHFWSLAVEEQYYLIWPIIFFIIPAFNKRLTLIFVLIGLSLLFRVYAFGNKLAYYNTLTAAEPLLLGALICILDKSDRLQKAHKYFQICCIISLVMLLIILIWNPNPFPDNPLILMPGYTNFNLIWAALISTMILKTKSSKISFKIFQSRLLIWLGAYSYGIYVYHWIILQVFVFRWESWLDGEGQPAWISYWCPRLIGIGLTLTVAFISFKYFERRFLALKKYFV
jgi:peptidoglycan/LPS O-acetylase OafA/YrhL